MEILPLEIIDRFFFYLSSTSSAFCFGKTCRRFYDLFKCVVLPRRINRIDSCEREFQEAIRRKDLIVRKLSRECSPYQLSEIFLCHGFLNVLKQRYAANTFGSYGNCCRCLAQSVDFALENKLLEKNLERYLETFSWMMEFIQEKDSSTEKLSYLVVRSIYKLEEIIFSRYLECWENFDISKDLFYYIYATKGSLVSGHLLRAKGLLEEWKNREDLSYPDISNTPRNVEMIFQQYYFGDVLVDLVNVSSSKDLYFYLDDLLENARKIYRWLKDPSNKQKEQCSFFEKEFQKFTQFYFNRHASLDNLTLEMLFAFIQRGNIFKCLRRCNQKFLKWLGDYTFENGRTFRQFLHPFYILAYQMVRIENCRAGIGNTKVSVLLASTLEKEISFPSTIRFFLKTIQHKREFPTPAIKVIFDCFKKLLNHPLNQSTAEDYEEYKKQIEEISLSGETYTWVMMKMLEENMNERFSL